MIRCPDCNIKIATYCTKKKAKLIKRYYKCPICGKTFVTTVKYKEIEMIDNKN